MYVCVYICIYMYVYGVGGMPAQPLNMCGVHATYSILSTRSKSKPTLSAPDLVRQARGPTSSWARGRSVYSQPTEIEKVVEI